MKIERIKDRNDIGHLFISKGPFVRGKYHSPELSIRDFRAFVDKCPYLTWEELNDYYIEECIEDNPFYLTEAQPIKILATSREIPDFIFKHQLYVRWSTSKRSLRIDYWKANKSMLYLLLQLANFMDGWLFCNNKIMEFDMVNRMDIEINSKGMFPIEKSKYSDR